MSIHRKAASTSRLPRSSTRPEPKAGSTLAVLPDVAEPVAGPSSAPRSPPAPGPSKAPPTQARPPPASTMKKRTSLKRTMLPPSSPASRPVAPAVAKRALPKTPAEDPEATVKPARRTLDSSTRIAKQSTMPSEAAALDRAQLGAGNGLKTASTGMHRRVGAVDRSVTSPASTTAASRPGTRPVSRAPSTPSTRGPTPLQRLSSGASSAGATPSPNARNSPRTSAASVRSVKPRTSATLSFGSIMTEPGLADSKSTRSVRTELASPARLLNVRKSLSLAQEELQGVKDETTKLKEELAAATKRLEASESRQAALVEQKQRSLAKDWAALHADTLHEIEVLRMVDGQLDQWRNILTAHVAATQEQ